MKITVMLWLNSDEKFFKKFERNEDGTFVKFLHPERIQDRLNEKIEPAMWMKQVNGYVVNAMGGQLSDKKQLFRIESQHFRTYGQPSKTLHVLVSDLI